MEYKEGKIYIGINQKNTKCYVYLDIYDPSGKVLTMLGQTSQGIVADFSQTACDEGTNHGWNGSIDCTSTDKGVYQAKDDYGTSYYYRGTVNNNWVKFAGYWWRIIRINGNGSIRMIYSGDGNTMPTDGRWSDKENSQTATSAYNSTNNDNTYVGFYIGTLNENGYSESYEAAHNNEGGPSTIATTLNTWYGASRLSSYSTYLDGITGWCNDREVDSTNGTGQAYGYNEAYYQPHFRLWLNKNPILTCTNKSRDLFTTNDTSTTNSGNKKLPSPVGLITADEVAMAGGVPGSNNYGYWLYTGNNYWTMSPGFLDLFEDNFLLFGVTSVGDLRFFGVKTASYGVRPVINLKAGTTLVNNGSGEKGTINNPYEVSN